MADRGPRLPAAILLAAACVAGCSGSSAGPSGGGRESASANVPTGGSASGAVSVPADVLDPIVADAAKRAAVDPSAVSVVQATARTWPNGALGCPSPGVLYTQAVVTGWQVVLEAGGSRSDYRSSGPGRFRLCTSGSRGGSAPVASGAPG